MEPIFPADTYPEEFAKVQAFLATASPDNVEHAIRFALLCNVVNDDGAITFGISPPVDVSALFDAGLITGYEDLTLPDGDPNRHNRCYFMNYPFRHGLLLQLAGFPALVDVFIDTILELEGTMTTLPLTPTGTLLTAERERFVVSAVAVWKTYHTHVEAAVPWPADPRCEAYARRARALRRARGIFVHLAWYYIGTGRFADAQSMLGYAIQAVHVAEVMAWKSENEWEDARYKVYGVDMCVAMVHACAEEEYRPFSTTQLYWKVCREWPEVLTPGRALETSPREMAGGAFRRMFPLLRNVLAVSLPQGMAQREDVEKLVGLTWVDGRWHNRLSIFTVGVCNLPLSPNTYANLDRFGLASASARHNRTTRILGSFFQGVFETCSSPVRTQHNYLRGELVLPRHRRSNCLSQSPIAVTVTTNMSSIREGYPELAADFVVLDSFFSHVQASKPKRTKRVLAR
ncbi:hypothetical protein B0T18DRAFT_391355 [Schizothecium vesticola]|uniref:Uncharacterized protein n=1 Tax=Schizothecium vesticola TaxID=314040 RepID=A0AA40EWU2_9PEZI|nr:hypothetical protein B0T18DRAFT_391355 [Schizothecium vesticola]